MMQESVSRLGDLIIKILNKVKVGVCDWIAAHQWNALSSSVPHWHPLHFEGNSLWRCRKSYRRWFLLFESQVFSEILSKHVFLYIRQNGRGFPKTSIFAGKSPHDSDRSKGAIAGVKLLLLAIAPADVDDPCINCMKISPSLMKMFWISLQFMDCNAQVHAY